MTPNLYVFLHTMVTPSQWVHKKHQHGDDTSAVVPGQPLARAEHWKSPVPGVYRHYPGAGWYLIQLDSDPTKPERPDRVLYSEPLHRGILEREYKARCVKAKLPRGQTPAASRAASPSRKPAKALPANSRRTSRDDQPRPEVNFVLHDDGVSWINDMDANGKPTKGPWPRFYRDKQTGEMRFMLKGDDPNYMKTAPNTSRPTSMKSGDSKSVASSIKAIAPELDGQSQQIPSFMGPRSLAGSSRTSPRSSVDMSRPTSVRLPSCQSTRKSPLVLPALSR